MKKRTLASTTNMISGWRTSQLDLVAKERNRSRSLGSILSHCVGKPRSSVENHCKRLRVRLFHLCVRKSVVHALPGGGPPVVDFGEPQRDNSDETHVGIVVRTLQ